MKKVIKSGFSFGLLFTFFAVCAQLPAAEAAASKAGVKVPAGDYFDVYTDAELKTNHFAASGFMGDTADVKIKNNQKINPHSGETCIRFVYTPAVGSEDVRWVGVQWQNPDGNWGSQDGGYDLSGAKRLTFWAKGKKGGERIDKFQVGGIAGGAYPDSDQESTSPIDLTTEWQQYSIDLTDTDLSYISGGFAWVANAKKNPEGLTFYLDDIRYEFN